MWRTVAVPIGIAVLAAHVIGVANSETAERRRVLIFMVLADTVGVSFGLPDIDPALEDWLRLRLWKSALGDHLFMERAHFGLC